MSNVNILCESFPFVIRDSNIMYSLWGVGGCWVGSDSVKALVVSFSSEECAVSYVKDLGFFVFVVVDELELELI